MAYIGQDPVIGRYILVDQISGGFNGTASGFTLAAGGQGVIPGLAQNVLLSLGGVIQQPGTDYTVSGSGITFTTPPLSGTTFFATVLGDVQAVGTPSDGTVLPASIASSGTFVFPNITTTGTTLIASGNASTPSLAVIGDTNTGLYSPGTDQLAISTGGTGRLFIDANGNIGVGTSSPASGRALTLNSSSNYYGLELQVGGTSIGSLIQETTGALYLSTTTASGILVFRSANQTEAARIDSSGRLLVGTSSARANLYNSTFTSLFQVEGTSYGATGGLFVCNINDDTTCSVLNLVKSRGTTVGSNTLVSSGDTVGALSFSGNDGTEFVQTALIKAEIDGTPGANDMPGRLVFSTTADGASSPTERMRITSAGNVGIGTTSPGAALDVSGNIRLSAGSPNIEFNNGGAMVYGPAGNTLAFATGGGPGAPQEKARIDSSGRLLVGTSSATGVNSNVAPVLAGNFMSFQGSVSASSGSATTLFALENLNATYMVTAIITGTASASAYHAVYVVGSVVTNSHSIQALKAGSLLTLSLSGANVQATQSSGISQTITWSVTRIANL